MQLRAGLLNVVSERVLFFVRFVGGCLHTNKWAVRRFEINSTTTGVRSIEKRLRQVLICYRDRAIGDLS